MVPEKRWRDSARLDGDRRKPHGSLVVALVLACLSLMVLDVRGGDDSPVEGARRVAGEVFGPVESGTSTVLRPFTAVPDWFRTRDGMQEQIDDLEAENARLRADAHRADYDRNRLEEYDGLTAAAADLGYAPVNKYLPPRAAPAHGAALQPTADSVESKFLQWVDRLLS